MLNTDFYKKRIALELIKSVESGELSDQEARVAAREIINIFKNNKVIVTSLEEIAKKYPFLDTVLLEKKKTLAANQDKEILKKVRKKLENNGKV